MRRKLMIGVAVLMGVVLFGGTVFSASNFFLANKQDTKISSIQGIAVFDVIKAASKYSVTFALYDDNRSLVSRDGHIKFRIYEKQTNQVLQQTEFDVKSSDFRFYKDEKGGDFYGYICVIDDNQVKKANDSTLGADIEFTLPDARVFKASRNLSQ